MPTEPTPDDAERLLEQACDWLSKLHSGQAFGWTGRILVFITGLICPLLFVTGLIRWLQKRRAKSAKSE